MKWLWTTVCFEDSTPVCLDPPVRLGPFFDDDYDDDDDDDDDDDADAADADDDADDGDGDGDADADADAADAGDDDDVWVSENPDPPLDSGHPCIVDPRTTLG